MTFIANDQRKLPRVEFFFSRGERLNGGEGDFGVARGGAFALLDIKGKVAELFLQGFRRLIKDFLSV